jgi:hypothetical protein
MMTHRQQKQQQHHHVVSDEFVYPPYEVAADEYVDIELWIEETVWVPLKHAGTSVSVAPVARDGL